MSIEVKSFIETSLVDWDGKVVSALFLPGCNFRCPYCHAAPLVLAPENLKTVPFASVEKYLSSHREWIDGVCISGGEPMVHPDLPELVKRIKALGFPVKLDTNGTNPGMLRELIKNRLIDYVAMDIKAPLNNHYGKVCGLEEVNLEAIQESIGILKDEEDINYEFRTTVVPALLGQKDIEEIARVIKGAKKFVLQQFVPTNALDPQLRQVRPYSGEEMEEFTKIASKFVLNSRWRGK